MVPPNALSPKELIPHPVPLHQPWLGNTYQTIKPPSPSGHVDEENKLSTAVLVTVVAVINHHTHSMNHVHLNGIFLLPQAEPRSYPLHLNRCHYHY